MVNLGRWFSAGSCLAVLAHVWLASTTVAQEAPAQAPANNANEPRPLAARADIGRGPFYVGQEIGLQVTVIGNAQRPEIDLPTIAGATLAPVGTSMRPLTTSAIGDFTLNEANAFLYGFRLVPERAGRLTIPAFSVRDGRRRGVTRALSIEVQAPPTVGRPPTFTGGVGPIEAHAEVTPEAIRVGQSFEYRVRLDGPGARGTARLPAGVAERLARLPLAAEITPLPPESSDSPPSRTFRFRLRPTRAGEVAFPPVVLSWFDPPTGRYQTLTTSSPRVRVVDVPALDPSRVEFSPAVGEVLSRAEEPLGDHLGRALTSRLFWATWWLPIALALLGWAFAQRRRRRIAIRTTLRAARRVTAMADQGAGAPDLARFLLETLARHLQLARGRPEGVLTSAEAGPAYHEATGDGDLARRVAKLVRRCERVLYAAEPVQDSPQELAAEAQGLLQEIAARTIPEDRPDSSPAGPSLTRKPTGGPEATLGG